MVSGPDAELFDVAAAADACASMDELEATIGRAIRAYGFEVLVGLAISRREGRRHATPVFGDVEHPAVLHYVEHGRAAYSPPLAAASTAPVFWHDLKKEPLCPRVAEAFRVNETFSIYDGCTVVVHPPEGAPVAVIMCGPERLDLSPPEAAKLHFLAIRYGLAGTALCEPADGTPAVSDRQLECLRWVREGKSSTDIGDILGISARTVETHLEEACRRLGVKTRTQAVVEAARLGLLAL
jgi:LuxR family quorum sensing-dependent transcriptional regulator